MALFSLSVVIILVLWGYGFVLIDRKAMMSGMVAIACYVLPIAILTNALEYVTENSGVVASATLGLSTTTKSQLVLVDVFFLFIALMNLWMIVASSRVEKQP